MTSKCLVSKSFYPSCTLIYRILLCSQFWRARRQFWGLWAHDSKSFILKCYLPAWRDSFEVFKVSYCMNTFGHLESKYVYTSDCECKISLSALSREADGYSYLFHRGCSELCRIPMVEYKLDSEGTPCEYKTPFRRNTTWHRVPTPAGQPLSRASPILGTSDRLQCQQLLQQAQTAIPRSTSFDRKLPDGAR